jgi:hypothetical protein
VSVAESVLAPPGPIPNPVVTQGSAGEYCGGDPVGGEAAAGTAPPPSARQPVPRGGAAAARWAHNPKVAGSNPAPATIGTTVIISITVVFLPHPGKRIISIASRSRGYQTCLVSEPNSTPDRRPTGSVCLRSVWLQQS